MAVQLKIEKDGAYTFYGRSMQPVKERNALLQPYGKQMQYYGQVLRLYPSKEQKAILNQQIGNARFVRNQYLNQRIQTYHVPVRKIAKGMENTFYHAKGVYFGNIDTQKQCHQKGNYYQTDR